ncbi:hypothetical protein HGRIS_008622 [Hohenbuehelia grisea]|uniref:F-box domain-containing protein n=1 Tax=Hohenbuehelia grisea TaxID=104357 RepID=A0ABR3JA07_9AGAR
MGFFKLLDISSPPGAAEHSVSFDLTSAYPPRRMPRKRIVKIPTPVHMPMEVVLTILEAAYYDNNLQPNDRLLKDCALVCRNWSVPAQKLLFSNVTLRTERAARAFLAAVNRSSDRGRMLGDAVIRMRAVLDHNQPQHLSQHSFAFAVQACPNLYELNLAMYGCGVPGSDVVGVPDMSRMRRIAPSFDARTLAVLKSGPRIRALNFSNWSDNRHSVMQLLDVWPSLTSLVMSGTAPQLPSASQLPFRCALHELRMNFQAAPSLDFVKWLLHNSADSLRILELEREPTQELLDYLVDVHGPSLQSLALPACGSHEHALAIQRCRALRELKLESPWVSPMVFRRLPDELQHVALGIDRDTALQPVIETVKSRPYLGVVTAHLWAGGEQHPQLPALKIACAYRGVELRLTNDIQVFRAMTRGDPVPNQGFPRIRSLANLVRMRC